MTETATESMEAEVGQGRSKARQINIQHPTRNAQHPMTAGEAGGVISGTGWKRSETFQSRTVAREEKRAMILMLNSAAP